MASEIYFLKPKTIPRDRRTEAKIKLDEFLQTFGNASNINAKISEPETDEQHLIKIRADISKLEGAVENTRSFQKSSVPYRKVTDSCLKLQIRLDNLQAEDMEALRQERRKALEKIEAIKSTLYSKTVK